MVAGGGGGGAERKGKCFIKRKILQTETNKERNTGQEGGRRRGPSATVISLITEYL